MFQVKKLFVTFGVISLAGCITFNTSSIPRYEHISEEVLASFSAASLKLYGLIYDPKPLNGELSYWTGCSDPITEEMVVSDLVPDKVAIEYVILTSKNGRPEKFEISVFDDMPNFMKGYVRDLFRVGNTLNVTYRVCGSGGFPTFVKVELAD